MLFSRTTRYQSALDIKEIKQRLLGQHLKVHNLDFEVYEKDENIKTLPITHVEFNGRGGSTQVVISSKMRKIDKGGPMLIVSFCAFLLIIALAFMGLGLAEYQYYAFVMLGISLGIFILFWIRMESGYFDYVRKIRDYIKKQSLA